MRNHIRSALTKPVNVQKLQKTVTTGVSEQFKRSTAVSRLKAFGAPPPPPAPPLGVRWGYEWQLQFGKWYENLLVGALVGQMLVRLVLDGEKVMSQERLFERQLWRIRDVRQAPGGSIYLLTDAAEGEILRLNVVQ